MKKDKGILEKLRETVLVCDGATGTRIQELSALEDEPVEYASVLKPDLVAGVHREYVEAGADIIETNTYRSNEFMLAKHGLQGRVEELNRASARLAVDAAAGKAYVLGSVGPTGRLMTPIGDLKYGEAYNAFRRQIAALAESGVDGIIIETMYDLVELKAAVLALKDVAPGMPKLCQMSFNEEGKTSLGTGAAACATVLEAMGADVIGANCSVGPASLVDVMREMARVTGNVLSVQPNAGFPTRKAGKVFYPATPEYMASFAKNFVDEGVSIVGGCCGTNPSHIREIANRIGGSKPAARKAANLFKLSGRTKAIIGEKGRRPLIIGNAISASSGDKFKHDLEARRLLTVQSLALRQVELGVDIILIDVPHKDGDSADLVKKILTLVQNAVPNPVAIRTANSSGLDIILETVEGKALILADAAEPQDLERILSIVKRYGHSAALAWTGGGAKQSLEKLSKAGIASHDSIFLTGGKSAEDLAGHLKEAGRLDSRTMVALDAVCNMFDDSKVPELLVGMQTTAVLVNTEIERELRVLESLLRMFPDYQAMTAE